MNKLLYISGPIKGMPDQNRKAFNEAANSLRDAGYAVLNPIEFGHVDNWAWRDYIRRDLKIILNTMPDGIAALPDGPIPSRGRALELRVAMDIGIPVHSVEFWTEVAGMNVVLDPNVPNDMPTIAHYTPKP